MIEINQSKHQGVPYSILYKAKDGRVDIKKLFSDARKVARAEGVMSPTFVLSSEVISNCTHASWRRVHEDIRDSFDKVEVHLAIRSPWSFLLSNWKQGQYRKGVSFASYANDSVKTENLDGINFWERRIAGFKNVYESVQVYPLEGNESVVKRMFRSALGVGLHDDHATKVVNESLSGLFCEVLSKNPQMFARELEDVEFHLPRGKNLLFEVMKKQKRGESVVFSKTLDWWFDAEMSQLIESFGAGYASVLATYGGMSETQATALVENERNRVLLRQSERKNREQEKVRYLEAAVRELYEVLVESLMAKQRSKK